MFTYLWYTVFLNCFRFTNTNQRDQLFLSLPNTIQLWSLWRWSWFTWYPSLRFWIQCCNHLRWDGKDTKGNAVQYMYLMTLTYKCILISFIITSTFSKNTVRLYLLSKPNLHVSMDICLLILIHMEQIARGRVFKPWMIL